MVYGGAATGGKLSLSGPGDVMCAWVRLHHDRVVCFVGRGEGNTTGRQLQPVHQLLPLLPSIPSAGACVGRGSCCFVTVLSLYPAPGCVAT